LEFRKNPFSKTKERKPRVEHPVPSFHQLKDIWKASNDYDHPLLGIMVKLKILTGMHFSEMEKILLEDVVNCGDWLEINHKIGIRHRIYLTPKVKELLEECIKFLDLSVSDSPLFTLDGVKAVSDRTINKHWNVMTRAMGMDFRFDRIRDSIVTEMKETGFESKYIVGHCYNENVQAKFYTDWKSAKMDQIFMEANKYWQERIYQAVNNHWF
jgi:integrase